MEGTRGRGCLPWRGGPYTWGAQREPLAGPPGGQTTSPGVLVAATTQGTETPISQANGAVQARTGRWALRAPARATWATCRRCWGSRSSRALRAQGRHPGGFSGLWGCCSLCPGKGPQAVGRQPQCCEEEQQREPGWESDAGASINWKEALNSPWFQPVPCERIPSSSETRNIC